MHVSVIVLRPSAASFEDLEACLEAERPEDWHIATADSIEEVFSQIADPSRHAVVMVPEQFDGGQSGLELIPQLRQSVPDLPVVVVADKGDVESAGRAVAAGATDFLVRGDNLCQRTATLLGKLRGLVAVIDQNRRLDQHNAFLRETLAGRAKIAGRSPAIKKLLEQIQRVAPIPRPVLIVGERGTGKELVARAIHLACGPASRPMVTVNCAAFSDALLESELFGHEKGAFTGADTARAGKFELADGGTLFLDEIGTMSIAFQEKILRVAEYGTFTRVGGSEELKTTARIIAATNRDLREAIREGRFLADLYDRLAFETIEAPPLRRRPADIPVLAQHFLDQLAKEVPRFAGKCLSREATDALKKHDFPGNVRELKNIIERAAYRDVRREITPEDLGLSAQDELCQSVGCGFQERLDGFARRLVHDALAQAGGNQAQAARDLGLSYHQFRYYFKKLLGNSKTCPHCGADRPAE
jgi:DNA-binding NtrC family response regulator